MPNDTEAMALALIRLLHEAIDGEAMQWHPLRRIDDATEEAVAFAAERGWVLVDDSRRVALTNRGRRLAEELGRPLH
jgi:hypothetical protein